MSPQSRFECHLNPPVYVFVGKVFMNDLPRDGVRSDIHDPWPLVSFWTGEPKTHPFFCPFVARLFIYSCQESSPLLTFSLFFYDLTWWKLVFSSRYFPLTLESLSMYFSLVRCVHHWRTHTRVHRNRPTNIPTSLFFTYLFLYLCSYLFRVYLDKPTVKGHTQITFCMGSPPYPQAVYVHHTGLLSPSSI